MARPRRYQLDSDQAALDRAKMAGSDTSPEALRKTGRGGMRRGPISRPPGGSATTRPTTPTAPKPLPGAPPNSPGANPLPTPSARRIARQKRKGKTLGKDNRFRSPGQIAKNQASRPPISSKPDTSQVDTQPSGGIVAPGAGPQVLPRAPIDVAPGQEPYNPGVFNNTGGMDKPPVPGGGPAPYPTRPPQPPLLANAGGGTPTPGIFLDGGQNVQPPPTTPTAPAPAPVPTPEPQPGQPGWMPQTMQEYIQHQASMTPPQRAIAARQLQRTGAARGENQRRTSGGIVNLPPPPQPVFEPVAPRPGTPPETGMPGAPGIPPGGGIIPLIQDGGQNQYPGGVEPAIPPGIQYLPNKPMPWQPSQPIPGAGPETGMPGAPGMPVGGGGGARLGSGSDYPPGVVPNQAQPQPFAPGPLDIWRRAQTLR